MEHVDRYATRESLLSALRLIAADSGVRDFHEAFIQLGIRLSQMQNEKDTELAEVFSAAQIAVTGRLLNDLKDASARIAPAHPRKSL